MVLGVSKKVADAVARMQERAFGDIGKSEGNCGCRVDLWMFGSGDLHWHDYYRD